MRLSGVATDFLRKIAYLKKAQGLRGKTLVPAVGIPTGTFAWMNDPERNILGLWNPKAHQIHGTLRTLLQLSIKGVQRFPQLPYLHQCTW